MAFFSTKPVESRWKLTKSRSQTDGEGAPVSQPLIFSSLLNAIEIVSDYRGDTYRGVYTTRIKGFIYVLHCFQKKSKAGIKTPRRDLELIRRRLADAELDFRARMGREV